MHQSLKSQFAQKTSLARQLIFSHLNEKWQSGYKDLQKSIERITYFQIKNCQDLIQFSDLIAHIGNLDETIIHRFAIFFNHLLHGKIQYENQYAGVIIDIIQTMNQMVLEIKPSIQKDLFKIEAMEQLFKVSMEFFLQFTSSVPHKRRVAQIYMKYLLTLEYGITQVDFVTLTQLFSLPLEEDQYFNDYDVTFFNAFNYLLELQKYVGMDNYKLESFFKTLKRKIQSLTYLLSQEKCCLFYNTPINMLRALQQLFYSIKCYMNDFPKEIAESILNFHELNYEIVKLTRKSKSKVIISVWIDIMLIFQKHQTLYKDIFVYSLSNFSSVMGMIDFENIIEHVNFTKYTLIFTFNQANQDLVTLFLNNIHGCCFILDMISFYAATQTAINVKKLNDSLCRALFWNQIKPLLEDQVIKEKVMVVTKVLMSIQGHHNIQVEEIEEIISRLPAKINDNRFNY